MKSQQTRIGATDVDPQMNSERQAPRLALGKQHLVQRIRSPQGFPLFLASATLLTTLLLVGVTYTILRAQATAAAQQHVTSSASLAVRFLQEGGSGPRLQNGQILIGSGAHVETLNNNTNLLASLYPTLGDHTAILQQQGASLAVVGTDGALTIGDGLSGPARDALLGACGPLAPTSCHHAYSGTVMWEGTEYLAAIQPLQDDAGGFAGALATFTPMNAVLAPVTESSVVIILCGLLVTLIVGLSAIFFHQRVSGRYLEELGRRLNHLATASAEMEHAAQTQVVASQRQQSIAQQISDGARHLDTLVASIRQGNASLQEAAGGIWMEMSQPGAAPDGEAATRLARQTVVTAAQIGVTSEDARTQCSKVVRLMNQVIAEGHLLTGSGRETEQRAHDLRAVIEKIEMTLGGRLNARPATVVAAPRRTSVSRALPPAARLPLPDLRHEIVGLGPLPIQPAYFNDVMGASGGAQVAPPSQPYPASPSQFPLYLADLGASGAHASPQSQVGRQSSVTRPRVDSQRFTLPIFPPADAPPVSHTPPAASASQYPDLWAASFPDIWASKPHPAQHPQRLNRAPQLSGMSEDSGMRPETKAPPPADPPPGM